MIAIGIDPGTPVTIVALTPAGGIMGVWDRDDVATYPQRSGKKTALAVNHPDAIAAILRPYSALGAQVVIERVSAMPGQGISSSTRFVGSMHLCHGIAVGIGMPATLVTPTAWKRTMGLTSDKEVSRAEALRRWPDHTHLFRRKGDHDRAEAALLAVWLQTKMKET